MSERQLDQSLVPALGGIISDSRVLFASLVAKGRVSEMTLDAMRRFTGGWELRTDYVQSFVGDARPREVRNRKLAVRVKP